MIFIIGCGGFAKEVLFLLEEVKGSLKDFKGFIDYKPKKNRISCRGSEFSVIDEADFLSGNYKKNEIELYIGIGDPKIIKTISEKFNDYKFPNLIHRNVIKDESVFLGQGNIITAGCILTVDIKIGSFNIFNLNTTIGHDTMISNFNVFNPGANVSGSVVVGSENLIGTNSTILQNLRIGDNSILGAVAVLSKDLGSNLIAVGIPAKPIKEKF